MPSLFGGDDVGTHEDGGQVSGLTSLPPPADATADSEQPAQKSKTKKKKNPKLSDEEMLAVVPPKVFSAKLNKKKVKVTVDGLGVHVVEDSKAGTDICSYRFKKLVAWGATGKKKDEFHLNPNTGDPLVFSTKEAPQLEMAVHSATGTLMAALALADKGTDNVADEQSAGRSQGHAAANAIATDDSVERPQPGEAAVANPVDFESDDDNNDQETAQDFSSSDDDDDNSPAD